MSVGAVTLIQELPIVNGRAINGGAIANAGSLVVVNASISGGSATLGGGILNSAGALSVFSSTLSGNSATDGGAIYNAGGGSVTLTSARCRPLPLLLPQRPPPPRAERPW